MGSSINLLLAVEPGDPTLPNNVLGSVNHPRTWYKITDDNVNQYVYADFIDDICNDLEQNPLPHDNERYFLWDNLALHGTAFVNFTLELRPTRNQFRFIAIPRPPYQPKFAPIEYVFCQIGNELAKRTREGDSMQIFCTNITDLCTSIGRGGSLDRTFAHCGYRMF